MFLSLCFREGPLSLQLSRGQIQLLCDGGQRDVLFSNRLLQLSQTLQMFGGRHPDSRLLYQFLDKGRKER